MREIEIKYEGPLPRKNKSKAPGIDRDGKAYIYTPKETKRTIESIGWMARIALNEQLGGRPLEGMVEVDIVFRFANDLSDSDGPVSPVLDAIKDIVMGDDRLVLKHSARIDLSCKWDEDAVIITAREIRIKNRKILTDHAMRFK